MGVLPPPPQQGVVRSIKPYGAFVDIGGITGLLHISQISHDHITDVTKVLREGQEISAMILTQDKEKGRFSLSTKVPLSRCVIPHLCHVVAESCR